MVEDIKQLDNWQIRIGYIDESMMVAAPFIRGTAGTEIIKNDILLWFDLEEGIAMTSKRIFKIGKPDKDWMFQFLALGNKPEDLEVKGTNH